MADRLYTSLKADEYISALRSATNLDKAVVARLAFAYSITTKGKDVPDSTNFSGGEMKRPTFVGNDEVFLRTLIGFVYQKMLKFNDALKCYKKAQSLINGNYHHNAVQ